MHDFNMFMLDESYCEDNTYLIDLLNYMESVSFVFITNEFELKY